MSFQKQWFWKCSTFSWTSWDLPVPSVTTDQIDETGGTLDMNWTLVDLAVYDDMECYFEYKDITAWDTEWAATTPTTLSAPWAFNDSVSVTSWNKIQVRAVAKNWTAVYYWAVKQVNWPLYLSIQDAKDDGMVFYLPLQESSWTDTQWQEVIAWNDMDFYNWVTISSDIINSNTVYKRVFDWTDYWESAFAPTISSWDWTVGIQVEVRGSSWDHSIWHLWTNTLSLAEDWSYIQLSVNWNISNSASWATPTWWQKIFNVVVDTWAWNTTTYENTATTDSQVNQRADTPNGNATFTRLARGASGDDNQQDNEYLNDWDIRCFYIYSRPLSADERKIIAKTLENWYQLIEWI